MCYIMQIVRLPPGNMSQIIQIIQIIHVRDIYALKGLDHEVGIGDLSDVCSLPIGPNRSKARTNRQLPQQQVPCKHGWVEAGKGRYSMKKAAARPFPAHTHEPVVHPANKPITVFSLARRAGGRGRGGFG